MKKHVLPSIDDIIFAMSEEPLGMGEEAKVYKIHTSPHYTVRVSNDAPDLETLSMRMYDEKFIMQQDILRAEIMRNRLLISDLIVMIVIMLW